MRTVGEGVETDDHVDLLQESGCDLMQGYLFSRPVKNEDFMALVADPLAKAA
jgi:EAL domain-containing protein (putative c-di-GMP-specific phosphodiesterase class I)